MLRPIPELKATKFKYTCLKLLHEEHNNLTVLMTAYKPLAYLEVIKYQVYSLGVRAVLPQTQLL